MAAPMPRPAPVIAAICPARAEFVAFFIRAAPLDEIEPTIDGHSFAKVHPGPPFPASKQ